MKLRMKGNLTAYRRELRAMARAVERDVATLPTRTLPLVRGLLLVGIRKGVYDTQPGRYVRTGQLLARAQVLPLPAAQPGVSGLSVADTAPHASFVEFGQGARKMPQAVATARAVALGPKPAPLYLGRSGTNYAAPNPAVTRATAYAAALMAQTLTADLRKRWKEGGQRLSGS